MGWRRLNLGLYRVKALPVHPDLAAKQAYLILQGEDLLLLIDQRGIQTRHGVFQKRQLRFKFSLSISHWHWFLFPPRVLYRYSVGSSLEVKRSSTSKLVYSTDGGRLCPQCQRKLPDCVCGKAAPSGDGDGIARIRRETKGRGGKAVTVIEGLPVAPTVLKDIAKAVKQRCGVGGAVKGATIEIQGDQRTACKDVLEKLGHTVKLAGG